MNLAIGWLMAVTITITAGLAIGWLIVLAVFIAKDLGREQ